MKTTITVETFDQIVERKLRRAARLVAKQPVAPERRITFDRPEDMAAFLTRPRVRLLEAAMEKAPVCYGLGGSPAP